MRKNMGNTDRIMRILFAIVVGVLYYMGVIDGFLAQILGVLAVVFVLTSFISFCPLYVPFRINTKEPKK